MVTGNSGFIGRYVERAFQDSSFDAFGYDLKDGLDLQDAAQLAAQMNGCNAVIHLAAYEGRSDSETMKVNLAGTWNVLCAARDCNVSRIIFMSSVDVLGIFQGEGVPRYLPIDDEYPCHPNRPYSISKLLAESMCQHFSESTGINIVCFRPPGVWDEATYDRITAARTERPEYEWDPYWEYGAFLDVRDLIEAILLALKSNLQGFQRFLLAADDITTSGMTALELVNKLLPSVEWRGGEEYVSTPFLSLIKTDNARKALGWSPKYTWQQYREKRRAL